MVTLIKPQAKMAAALVKMRQQHHNKLIDIYINDCAKWIEERAKGTLYKKTREIAESVSKNRRTVVPSCHSAGKALDLDTWLPTPNGWITMREINIGDQLFDENGKVCNVIAISDVEERECYKIKFSDGTYIIAADNHLWSLVDFYKRPRNILDWRNHWNKTRVVTTQYIVENLTTNLGQLRWKLPINNSLNTSIDWKWQWEPYTYGCWLGDGTTVRWELTCHSDDSEHFASMTNGRIWEVNGRPTINIIKLPGKNTLDCPTKIFGIDRKIIPVEMLRTSRENRLDLLRGLMDTDGTISIDRKTVEIDLSNKELAYTVVELIRTLGWKAGISSRETIGNTSYRIHFTPSENPFYLQRKALRWELIDIIGSKSSRVTQKSIESVEYVGKKLVKCVEVDSPRNLYLAGDGFNATHNSWLSARIAAWWIDSHPPGSAFVVTTAPTNKQIRAVLWKELRRVYVTANLQGRLNQTEWWLNNEMVAMGRKPSDYDPTAFNGIHCLDIQHEILTKNGWKTHEQLSMDDEVLSVNLETNITEWKPINKIYKYKYSGMLNVYEDRRLNFAITSEHKLPIKNNDRWELTPVNQLSGIQRIRRTGTWDGEDFDIPEEFKNFNLTKQQFAFLIGYWIGDGGVRKHGTGRFYEVMFYRTKNFYIDTLLTNIRTYIGKDFIGFSNRQCAEWLINNIGRYQIERRIPRFLLDAPISILEHLIRGLWESDGTFKNDDRAGYYSANPTLIGQIQEIMLKMGRAGTVGINRLKGSTTQAPQGVVNVNSDTLIITWNKEELDGYMINTTDIKQEPYDGIVWCIETEYNTFFTRRNGKVHLTGNSKYVLVIIDEGGGVPENIFIAANSLVSNEFGRMFVVGNPDDSGTHFERICKPDSGWVVIPISAYDTPNFTGEYVPQDVKDVLISQIYVDELRRDVGEDSAVFQSKVLAKFPSGKNDGVIPYHFIIQCMDQNEEYSEEDLLPIEMGVDVGAGGDDTSIRIRYGMLVGPGGSLKTPKPEEAFAFILENVIRHNVSRVKIDIIGLGWGLLGMLDSARMRGKHYNEILDEEIDVSHVEFIGVNVGQRATDPERFPRLRDQLWWEVGRELSRTKGWDLTGLDDKTIGQLTDPTWKPDLAGRHKVESKQDTIKRTGRSSPNEADALLLAYCVPPMPETEELAVYYDPVEVGPNI